MKKISIVLISTILLIISLIGCTRINSAETTEVEVGNVSESQFETYESKKFGFALQFPISWGDNYIIKESEDYLEVSFIGNSETSKNYDEDLSMLNGLTMFYIGSEDYINDMEFIDNAQEIGKVHNINYYYFTSTDYPLGALMSEYIEDEKEKELAANDYLIAKEMTKDIENIIKTFKTLE